MEYSPAEVHVAMVGLPVKPVSQATLTSNEGIWSEVSVTTTPVVRVGCVQDTGLHTKYAPDPFSPFMRPFPFAFAKHTWPSWLVAARTPLLSVNVIPSVWRAVEHSAKVVMGS